MNLDIRRVLPDDDGPEFVGRLKTTGGRADKPPCAGSDRSRSHPSGSGRASGHGS